MSAGAPLIVVVAGAARSTSSTRDAVRFHSVDDRVSNFFAADFSRRGKCGTPVFDAGGKSADACGQQPPPKQQ